ncbi:hypothetical protein CKM354_000089800 [Cercospora kikuchii]|uniref:Amine oxidase domain-containing protein n=1 Tax=Cercospora kikuchii TaxID=84275 RepID=A0A9P3C688_9PEZI|nr:uncharacterized protein CKM354_000089800 [Cercospora kikuchii]GIZ37452.1 hypothetical protein CKM354_000089800 [Cercospora kikuchii]
MATNAAHSEGRHHDVLVLGAGMSGLACASRLYQHRHFQEQGRLLVLEARDRLGGRIESVSVDGHRLDTGANWIHGVGTESRPNPLMAILPHKRYKSLSGTVAFSAPSNTKERGGEHDKSATSPRKAQVSDLVIPASTAGTIMGAFWDMIDSLHESAVAVSLDVARATTVLDTIKQSADFFRTFKDVPQQYRPTLGSMPQFVEVMEAAPLAAQSAEQEKGKGGMALLEFAVDGFEGEHVFLQDGYTQVVDEVSKGLMATGVVQLGVEVRRIDWSCQPVRVETSQGVYTADQVVCTLPLGVLQHDARRREDANTSLFSPALPANKRESVQKLGFGTLNKILLVYRDPWWVNEPWITLWKKGMTNFHTAIDLSEDCGVQEVEQDSPDAFMGFTTELPGISFNEDGTTAAGPRLLSIMNLQNLTDKPALSCFVACSNAVQMEAMSDDQASGIVHQALTQWLGREPPRPSAVHVTRWASDKYSRGSYSHMIKDLSESRHRVAFQEPLTSPDGGIVRFAGEHTDVDHFATVHGALISGWREADAILNSLKLASNESKTTTG